MSSAPIDDGNAFGDLAACEDKHFRIICNRAKSQGLKPNEIMILITSIESKEIDNKVKLQRMKCLIPQETIPEDAFIRMTCLLCDFKFPRKLKVEILKWMISVYSFIETPALKFQFLYETFFTLIEQEKLSPYVCHFIFLITRKEMVTAKRVESILKLLEKYGNEPCLIMVLHSYYMLSPEYFHDEMNDDFEYDFESLGIYPSLIKHIHPSYELHASSFQYVTTQDSSNIKILSESSAPVEKFCDSASFILDPFQETYQEFKALEVSTNISKILKSRLRRLFITSDLPLKTEIKLHDYILTLYYQNLDSPEFLETILEAFHEMRDSFPVASDFTDALVSSYSENVNLLSTTVAEILYYEPISCFEKIRYKMDRIREALKKCTSVFIKCQLLNCLSNVYQNWILMEYNYSTEALIPCDGGCSVSNESSSTMTEQAHLPSDEIYKLCSYIDLICNELILDDDLHPCLLNEILLHYERVSIARSKANKILDIHFLTCPVFQLALFSLSACTLDNLARLILRYDAEIRNMQRMHPSETDVAARFTKLHHDLKKILLDGSYKVGDNTYLTKASAILRLKEKCPRFESYFALHRHPALLLKTMPYINQKQLSNFPNDRDSLSSFQRIAEGACKHLVKLVTVLINK